jgi:hypothetical protein
VEFLIWLILTTSRADVSVKKNFATGEVMIEMVIIGDDT